MNKVLDSWSKDWALMPYFFESHEVEEIKNRLCNLKINTLVYCAFENRFARSGGLAAVTMKILPYLKEVNNIPTVILMTPFHSKIINAAKLQSTGLDFYVLFDRQSIKVEIFEYALQYSEPQKGAVKEYYLKADGYFDAQNRLNDPYIFYEEDRQKNDEAIRKNALFFCQSVPLAMQKLNLQENIVFHLQDWQMALLTLIAKLEMLKGTLKSCGTVLTLHNTFDSFISWGSLAKIMDEERFEKIAAHVDDGLTALQIGLQCVDAPITTVSDNFAQEFTADILQSEHFAPHLQHIFKKTGVFGINNGLFVDFAPEFSKDETLTIDKIKTIKSRKRKTLLKVLDEYLPPERFGKLTYDGGSIMNLPDSIPIFVMSGRLDYNQKGYDIFLQTIERFQQDEIKVILTPMPVKPSDLDFFHEIVSKCKGNVTVYPIRMVKGFRELQIGSTYGVMPSIYEPFGAAIEYMVNGTVNIARKTGGLVDQLENARSGIMYREGRTFYNLKNIEQFSDLSDTVDKRKGNKWVQSMIDELYEAMKGAINLYQNHRNEYYRLILMGFKKAKTFDWKISAKKYFAVYEKVNKGF